jgi:FtsP/CotA-like multicopper oxidase with cupredoxin domain
VLIAGAVHLHGHKFQVRTFAEHGVCLMTADPCLGQVVYKSMDVTSDDPTINPPFNKSSENQVNPLRRDTVTAPGGGLVALRFRADNPGACE